MPVDALNTSPQLKGVAGSTTMGGGTVVSSGGRLLASRK